MIPYILLAVICGGVAATVASHKDKNPTSWFFAGMLGSVGLLVLAFILKFLFLYGIYDFWFDHIAGIFGFEAMHTRLISIVLTVGVVAFIPWLLAFIFLGQKRMEVLAITVASCLVFGVAVHYFTKDHIFGPVPKYYIKTLEGFRVSDTEKIDRQFNIKYQPFNTEVAKEYYIWKKTGKMGEMPAILPGKYFDHLTGEAIVWYSKANGEIHLYSLPGYDPATGVMLSPITTEIAKFCPDASSSISNVTKCDDGSVTQSSAKTQALDYTGVVSGDYFNHITGAAKVWYSRGNGKIRLFPGDGYDSITGQKLQPMTIEIANLCPDPDKVYYDGKYISECDDPQLLSGSEVVYQAEPEQQKQNTYIPPPVPAYAPKFRGGSPGPPPPGHSGKTWILTFLGDQMGNPVSVSIGNNYVDIKGDGMDCSATKEKPGFFRGKGSKDGKYGDCSVIMGQYGGTGGWLINGEQINFELNKSG